MYVAHMSQLAILISCVIGAIVIVAAIIANDRYLGGK